MLEDNVRKLLKEHDGMFLHVGKTLQVRNNKGIGMWRKINADFPDAALQMRQNTVYTPACQKLSSAF